jgi:hypothetical protein
LLPSPIFFLFMLEAKMGVDNKLATIALFFFYCFLYKQGDNNKLVVVTPIFFPFS